MKNITTLRAILFTIILLQGHALFAQTPANWTSNQLMQPADLAGAIKAKKNVPLIYCVGPGAPIPGSINIGPGHDENNITAFKKALATLPKDAAIVIYCGCCPFEHCPNVRPAIDALKQAGFTNYKLLNLEHNVKTDWLDKGYPKQ